MKSFVVEFKPTFLFLVAMLPAYFIMMSYYLDKTIGYGSSHSGFEELMEYFLSMRSLVSFRDEHILIGRVLLVALAIALLLTFIDRARQVYRFRSSSASDAPEERLWTKIVTRKDQFLIMAVILTVMYFRYPWYIGSGGAWINDRIHIYIFLVLLPFFSVNLHRYIKYAMAGILIALSLWHLGYNIQTYYLLNRDIKNAVSWDVPIEKHTILTSRPGEWNGLADSLGRIPKYVEPFGHLECYLARGNGIAYLDNYEAETDHFPVNYRDEDRDWSAEYVVVWRTEYDDVEDLVDDYDLIHSNDYNRLYRRRKAKPDEALWGGRVKVEFDMQSHNGQTAPGNFAVYDDTVYTDGRYGWLTRSDRGEFLSEADIPEPYKDSVWGEEDGVFRVALPNGEYEVTCYFCSGGSEPLEINLIANGEKRIKKLRLPTGNEIVEKNYNVTITDERLTQIIYTRRKGSYQRWGWNGCKIERIID